MNWPFNNFSASVDTAGLGLCYYLYASQFENIQNSDCNNSV